MALDIRTLMWLTSVAAATMALWLLTTVPPTQRLRDRAPWFLRGTGLLSVGFFLLAQRGEWPDWITLVVANLAVVAAVHSYHLGMRSMGSGGGPGRLDVLAELAFVAIFGGACAAGAPNSVRVALVSAALVAGLGATAWQARRNRELMALRSGRATLAWLAGLALILTVRAIVIALVPAESQSLFTRDAMGMVTFTVAFMVTLTVGIGYLGIARERSEVELERHASVDPLTGLSNRRILFEHGVRQVAQHRRYGRPLAMLIIDLDHFKAVNDRHGHLTGDLALQCFAAAATQQLRTSDLLARAGGEEFCAVLPETDLAGARIVAERIRAAVQGAVVGAHTPPLTMTCSIGVAVLHAGELTIDGMFNRADTAMYAAKAAGRNRVMLANPVESLELARA